MQLPRSKVFSVVLMKQIAVVLIIQHLSFFVMLLTVYHSMAGMKRNLIENTNDVIKTGTNNKKPGVLTNRRIIL